MDDEERTNVFRNKISFEQMRKNELELEKRRGPNTDGPNGNMPEVADQLNYMLLLLAANTGCCNSHIIKNALRMISRDFIESIMMKDLKIGNILCSIEISVYYMENNIVTLITLRCKLEQIIKCCTLHMTADEDMQMNCSSYLVRL